MPVDEVRARYLRDKVMTATPAQRIVMLYDRLGLDLNLAESAPDVAVSGTHLHHATEIVAELHASLDHTAGGPADNLSSIYAYLLQEILAVRGGATERLASARGIVSTLRGAWAQAADMVAATSVGQAVPRAAGAWVS
jgi:flagellar secretion chaperone FliS